MMFTLKHFVKKSFFFPHYILDGDNSSGIRVTFVTRPLKLCCITIPNPLPIVTSWIRKGDQIIINLLWQLCANTSKYLYPWHQEESLPDRLRQCKSALRLYQVWMTLGALICTHGHCRLCLHQEDQVTELMQQDRQRGISRRHAEGCKINLQDASSLLFLGSSELSGRQVRA